MAKCPMYLTIGVCRRGDYCTRYHNRPTISPTLLLSNMYQRLDKITPGINAQGNPIDPNQIQEHYFVYFYKDIFKQLSKYGEIMCLHVCDNLAHHMAGNVYVQFRHEKHAEDALKDLQGMLYNNGRPIRVDYSPVTNFYHATCRLFEKKRCKRGFKCNFLHVKKIRRELMRKLYGRSWRSWYSRSQSRNPSYRRDRESRKRSHERGDHRDRDRERHERLRYSRSQSRSHSFRRDRERSHERGDHRDRDWKRHERLRYSQSRRSSPSFRRDRERSHERGDHRDRDQKRHERLRYSRSRSSSPSFRRDRERSHERGDHRDRDRKRYGRLRYSRSRSRSRSPSFRRDRGRSHERGDLRDRDRVRHEMRYERCLGGRGIGGVEAGAGALVTEGIVERGHMKEVIKGAAVSGTEIRKGMKGGLRGGQGSREGRSRSPVRVSSEERRAKIED